MHKSSPKGSNFAKSNETSYLGSGIDVLSDFDGNVGVFVLVGEGVAVGVVAPEEDPLSLLFCIRVLWSASNTSKSFDLPATSLLDAKECV